MEGVPAGRIYLDTHSDWYAPGHPPFLNTGRRRGRDLDTHSDGKYSGHSLRLTRATLSAILRDSSDRTAPTPEIRHA